MLFLTIKINMQASTILATLKKKVYPDKLEDSVKNENVSTKC